MGVDSVKGWVIGFRVLFLLSVVLCHCSVDGQLCTSDGKCDRHERCSAWKEEGECLKNPTYMLEHCPASCNGEKKESDYTIEETDEILLNPPCVDKHKFCSIWASLGECEENEINMKEFCAKSCNACDSSNDIDNEDDVERYLSEEDEIESNCQDNHESCSSWAKVGECEVNPNYMLVNCAKSCGSCEKLEPILDPTESRYVELAKATLKFGLKQQIKGAQRSQVADIVQASIHYLEDPQTKQLPEHVLKECQNRNELCAFWALVGT
jgi:ShK domain-like